MERAEHKAVASEVGLALVGELPTKATKIIVTLDAPVDSSWAPPVRFLQGGRQLVVEVANRMLCIDDLGLAWLALALRVRDGDAWASRHSGKQCVWQFLLDLSQVSSCSGSIFRQFVIGIGTALDTELASSYVRSLPGLRSDAAPQSTNSDGALKNSPEWDTEGHIRENLLKY